MSLKCKGGLFDAGTLLRNGERKQREDDYACMLKSIRILVIQPFKCILFFNAARIRRFTTISEMLNLGFIGKNIEQQLTVAC